MNVWIDLAEKTPDDDEHAHMRFVFYWIAYEAAYQAENYGPHSDGRGVRNAFHAKLARHDRGRLRNILREAKEDVVAILQLRQASEYFWRKDENVRSPDDWEQRFEERTRKAKRRLEAAIDEWRSPKSDDRTRDTLDDLFRSLNLVRNQIVHGGSAGPQSQGRTQVLLAARLLTTLVPCFRDSIESRLDADWGRPPFPRVGEGRDDKCPPPWLGPGGPRTEAAP